MREYFAYDDLDRSISSQIHTVDNIGNTLAIQAPKDFIYDNGAGNSRGKMHETTDIGKFTYANHQVSKAHGFDFPQDPNDPPEVINFDFPQDITYTPFNQPASITETVDNIPYGLYYNYGNDQQRCRSKLVAGVDVIKTIWYNGSHEQAAINGSQSEIHYRPSASGICAMIVVENGVESIYPVYTDQLGSIVALTDQAGNIVARQQYDAWGRSRNVEDWTYNNIDPVPEWLYRGYTGHEHLRQFTLINMNGRLYDPLTTRMLSADNFVALATSTQAFNRYAYALNNPLKYTDPSGELVWFLPVIAGAIIGSYIGGAISAGDGGLSGANWNPFRGNAGSWKGTDWWKGATIGGLIGAGVGLGLSSLLTGVTGLSSNAAGIASWSLGTSNLNMATSLIEGYDADEIFKVGVSGAVFGAAFAGMGLASPKFGLNGAVAGALGGLSEGLIEKGQYRLSGNDNRDNLLWKTIRGGGVGALTGTILSAGPSETTWLRGRAPLIGRVHETTFGMFGTYASAYTLKRGLEYGNVAKGMLAIAAGVATPFATAAAGGAIGAGLTFYAGYFGWVPGVMTGFGYGIFYGQKVGTAVYRFIPDDPY